MHRDFLAMLNLINPLRNPLYNYFAALEGLVLGAVAVVMTYFVVSIVEPDNAVIRRTTQIVAEATQ